MRLRSISSTPCSPLLTLLRRRAFVSGGCPGTCGARRRSSAPLPGQPRDPMREGPRGRGVREHRGAGGAGPRPAPPGNRRGRLRRVRGRTPDCPVGQLGAWLDGRPLEDATLASYLAELHEPGPGAGEASTAVAAVCCRACLAGEPSPSDRCDRKPGASAAIRGGNHVRPGPEGTAARPSVGLKARRGAISVVRGLTLHRFRSGVCTVPAADGQPAQRQSRLRPPAELGAVGSPAGWTMPH